MVGSSREEEKTTSIAIIAIVAALAVFGVVLVTVAETMQQAEARGCPLTTPAANASKGRCFHP